MNLWLWPQLGADTIGLYSGGTNAFAYGGMMRFRRALSFMLLMIGFATQSLAVETGQVVTLLDHCEDGVSSIANTPYSILVSCEDALGNQIGLIHTGKMKSPRYGDWGLADRFWQDEEWANDVTAYAIAPSARALFVSTSEVYGAGGVFRLDLSSRKHERIFPKGEHESTGRIFTLQLINESTGQLKLLIETDGKIEELEISIR